MPSQRGDCRYFIRQLVAVIFFTLFAFFYHLFWRPIIFIFHRPIRLIFGLFEGWLNGRLQIYQPVVNNTFLNRQYAPVPSHVFAKELRVVGTLPLDLNGMFVRNGPNPYFDPSGGYHWFDGDGMLHGLRIRDGRISYVNKWVQTKRLQEETAARKPFHVKIGDMRGKVGLAKLILDRLRPLFGVPHLVDNASSSSSSSSSTSLPMSSPLASRWAQFLRLPPALVSGQTELRSDGNNPYDKGTANTNLVYHNGQLMALVENAIPYSIKMTLDGQLETLGAFDYHGALRHAFTAHPKVDAETDEMFFFGYEPTEPFVSYRAVSPSGQLSPVARIPLRAPVMMHDFAISPRFAIFMEFPLVFRLEHMLSGGLPWQMDYSMTTRFLVVPRNPMHVSQSTTRVFETEACFAFHVAACWEDEISDEVVLVACRYKEFDLDFYEGPSSASAAAAAAQSNPQSKMRGSLLQPKLYEWRFNMSNGNIRERNLCDELVEFPRAHPDLTVARPLSSPAAAAYNNLNGSPSMVPPVRYLYCATLGPRGLSQGFGGVIKFDLKHNRLVKKMEWGADRTGGECVFVPRQATHDEKSLPAEDDGYLVTIVYNQKHERSQFVVLNAKNMDPTPLAVVDLPGRVPMGFHGLWVTEAELAAQKTLLSSLDKERSDSANDSSNMSE